MAKKSLKGGLKKPKPETGGKPFCPLHNTTMMFEPEKGAWTCPNDDCEAISMPNREILRGKPIVVVPQELWIVNGQHFLRSEDNVMMNLSDPDNPIIHDVMVVDNGAHPPTVTITIILNGVTEVNAP